MYGMYGMYVPSTLACDARLDSPFNWPDGVENHDDELSGTGEIGENVPNEANLCKLRSTAFSWGRSRLDLAGRHRRNIRQPSGLRSSAVGSGHGAMALQTLEKPVDSSHWLSLTTMAGEHREREKAQVALSPNSGPRQVLRPLSFALPGPLSRPADPISLRRIANPC